MGNSSSVNNFISELNKKNGQPMMFGKPIDSYNINIQDVNDAVLLNINGNTYFCNGTIKCDNLKTMFAIVYDKEAYFRDIEK
jgi:hypothetical protein